MKRPVRADDGKYHLKSGVFAELFGSRTQVMNGTAYKTSGELKKKGFDDEQMGSYCFF